MSRLNLCELIGVPFADLGRDPQRGLDCWGLVMEVQRRYGRTVPDYAVSSAFASEDAAHRFSEAVSSGRWDRVEDPQPGDVVVMETNPSLPGCIDHCGVVVDGGRMMHAIQKHEVSAPKLTHLGLFGRVRGFYRWRGGE